MFRLKFKYFLLNNLPFLNYGIPLMQALELMVEQTEGQLKNIVIYLKDNIKGGDLLLKVFQNIQKFFDNIYIQLVKAGEASAS